MKSSIKWMFALGVGIVGGWAARSLSDSPEGAGVKLLELGIKAKDRLDGWVAVERERLDDMLAEAHSNIAHETAAKPREGHAGGKRGAHLVRHESQHSEPVV